MNPEKVKENSEKLAQLETTDQREWAVRHAVKRRASDVYILTDEDCTRLQIRRFGLVEPVAEVSHDQGRQLISAIKAAAGMDIAEKRRPLEGRWILEPEEGHIDLRIASVPTLWGEDMTLRILDRKFGLMALDQLGMTRDEVGRVRAMLSNPSGLILVTGPTGAGKTTTLYAFLQHLNDAERKINTIEDPIEYAVPGLRQSQVNEAIGVTFPGLLRHVLRQSPDVIMIGEIRDEQTAATAVRAANSGHLVLATLHSPVAAAAVESLLALGSNPHFLASGLLGVISQRLIRVLSKKSRVAYDISEAPDTFSEIEDLLEPDEAKTIYGPGEGDLENPGGYSHRTGLFEVMTMNRELRKLIAEERTADAIQTAAISAGMVEFRRGALLRVAQGVTSTEETLRCLPAEYLGIEE